jgi:hypothetical protein
MGTGAMLGGTGPYRTKAEIKRERVATTLEAFKALKYYLEPLDTRGMVPDNYIREESDKRFKAAKAIFDDLLRTAKTPTEKLAAQANMKFLKSFRR